MVLNQTTGSTGTQFLNLDARNWGVELEAQWAPKLSVRPQWQTQGLSSSAEVRKFVDQIKLQMRRWDDED